MCPRPTLLNMEGMPSLNERYDPLQAHLHYHHPPDESLLYARQQKYTKSSQPLDTQINKNKQHSNKGYSRAENKCIIASERKHGQIYL